MKSTVISLKYDLSVINAIVGGIALTGALSIGVIQRTKKIGVMSSSGMLSHSIL